MSFEDWAPLDWVSATDQFGLWLADKDDDDWEEDGDGADAEIDDDTDGWLGAAAIDCDGAEPDEIADEDEEDETDCEIDVPEDGEAAEAAAPETAEGEEDDCGLTIVGTTWDDWATSCCCGCC